MLVIVLIPIAVYLFLAYYWPMGGLTNKQDWIDYSKRNPYFDNGKFYYPEKWNLDGLENDNRISDKPASYNKGLPYNKENYLSNDLSFSWLGHSMLLIQLNGFNILADPVFSKRAFALKWIGPARFTNNFITEKDLPEIDMVILSHDHHDHLDPYTIKQIDKKVKRYIVPLGLENHLLKWNISKDKITNLAWWENVTEDRVTITCTPARHFSGRRLIDSNNVQFSSFVIEHEDKKLFFSADGAIGKHFELIQQKFDHFDIAFMECGQYNSRWHYSHLYPEESVLMAKQLKAKMTIPIHWGVFVLSDHGWDDSIVRYEIEANKQEVDCIIPLLGEKVSINNPKTKYTDWWKQLD